MIRLTRTPSEKIKGAVEVKLETLLSTKTILTDDHLARQVLHRVILNTLDWVEDVPNLIEIGEGKICENIPSQITIAIDYANAPDTNSIVYLKSVDENETQMKTYTHRGFNRVGGLIKVISSLTEMIEEDLREISEIPNQTLPRYMILQIMSEARDEGMDYDFDTFDDDLSVSYFRRKMLLVALTYLKTPLLKEMATREIFGWNRALSGDGEE